ncbi:Putative protein [Zobellia galactanivorans]|uniref:Uncharacterized protein n=1 Tax=Zobellia galactanivorans (strain DSM 12802 / CCUG 47099 / CIP 106680 / NCIMB 13871 / Dsij) TaxID=63186 RepID=G0LBU1_ZOBGA|nr:hypothetical protein B4Q04_06515 [Zobellia sp. OII3]CAZ96454.1 Putative protein [Zobellia galactanivorans]
MIEIGPNYVKTCKKEGFGAFEEHGPDIITMHKKNELFRFCLGFWQRPLSQFTKLKLGWVLRIDKQRFRQHH